MENIYTNEGKGCVYFFKHVGSSPIKIGFSTKESPIERFESFKTYAPYGGEIVGFIRSFEAKALESELHVKLSASRLNGEWFDITIDKALNLIKYYTGTEDQEEVSLFNIEFAKKLERESVLRNKVNQTSQSIVSKFNLTFRKQKCEEYTVREVLNKGELRYILGCDRYDIENIIEYNNLKYSTKRIGDRVKQGIELFSKEDCDLKPFVTF